MMDDHQSILCTRVPIKKITKPNRPGVMRSLMFPKGFVPEETYNITMEVKGYRGGHWHLRAREIMLCSKGKVTIYLKRRKEEGSEELIEEQVVLTAFDFGTLIEPGVWHRVLFEPGAELVVYNTDAHNENGYHENDEFEDHYGRIMNQSA